MRRLAWVVIFVMWFSVVCHAGEVKKAQGTVVFIKNNTVIVGERVFVCNENTQLLDEQGGAVALDQVRVKDSVRIESVTEQGKNVALRIIVLKRGR